MMNNRKLYKGMSLKLLLHFLSPFNKEIMMRLRLTVTLLTICSTQILANVFGQRITLNERNASLISVLKKIEKQSGYTFFYNKREVDVEKININVREGEIAHTLDILFKDKPYGYDIQDKIIVLNKKEQQRQGESVIPVKVIQQTAIKGKVQDEKGQPISGVSIHINEGADGGAITDKEGFFTIVASPRDRLTFRFVGKEPVTVTVGNQKEILVTMLEKADVMEDVVVVAFGNQKKSDMVGSVTSVNPSDLKVPSSNLTTALAGRAAGVIAYQRSGEPGADNAEFFIRGVTTFGYKKDPLILIDGIEFTTTDLARLQVDDIKNFSILKDATATALYGSRAANGVILVTTKNGIEGKAKLAFRLENSVSTPTQNVELADPVTYMKLSNEATLTRDPLGQILYDDRKIENTVVGGNSIFYPSNDWREILFKDYTINQRANLSVSGGGGVARYYVSGSVNKDNGLMKVDKRNNFNSNIDLKSYSLRSNVNIDLTKTTEMIVRLSGNFDDYSGPIDGGKEMYGKVMRTNPVLFPAYYTTDENNPYNTHIMFGNYDDGSYLNPYADMVKGYKEYARSVMLAQLELKQNLDFFTEGLSFSGMMSTTRNSYFDVRRAYKPFWYSMSGYDERTGAYALMNINPTTGTEYLDYNEGPTNVNSNFYLETRLNYNRTFNKHGVSALLVSMAQTQLNANAGDLQKSLPYRNFGISGRSTYDYDKRYYVEFNFGFNGSERFYKTQRFGFFPSVGLAWTVSREKFFEGIKPVISNLRVRGTYGLIGNDAIGSADDRFFYLSNVNMNDADRRAFFGNDAGNMYMLNGISTSRYSNQGITWEVSTQKNLALELGLFDRLNITAEYFSQYRDRILMTRAAIPVEAGFSAPIKANLGAASANGIDVSMDYKYNFSSDLWLSAMGNFTYSKNKYEVYEEPKYNEAYRYRVGNSINQKYGYIAERLFIDDEEALNSPRQNFGEYGGGDIKYLDVNRDGEITEADMVPIGNPTVPEIVYGFGFSAGYKGFDISAFFQGLANESFWIDAEATAPFVQHNQLLKVYADSHWSEDHRDIYALWPRLSSTVNKNNTQPSTWFMRDGAFLRLKQVEVGYTLSDELARKIYMSKLRIYVNASNLLAFSRFGLWDVEMGGEGLGYPIQKVFNIGLNININ